MGKKGGERERGGRGKGSGMGDTGRERVKELCWVLHRKGFKCRDHKGGPRGESE